MLQEKKEKRQNIEFIFLFSANECTERLCVDNGRGVYHSECLSLILTTNIYFSFYNECTEWNEWLRVDNG